MKSYAGFGGIPAILFPGTEREGWVASGAKEADLQLLPLNRDLHLLLSEHLAADDYKQAVSAMKESVLSAFYTPTVIPQVLFEAMIESGLSPQRIYEPSAGAGIFITEAVRSFPNLQEVTAV